MPDQQEATGANEVERLLAEAPPAGSGAADAVATGDAAAAVDKNSIDSLLDEAQAALSSLEESPAALPPGMKPFEFKDLAEAAAAAEPAPIDLLRDVQLELKIELGRTHMHLEDVLRLKQGAVVTLDKLAGDPVDVYVNGRLIARGEVLVLNDSFCVRVTELISGESGGA